MTITSSAENYTDTTSCALGAEYTFAQHGAAVRGGYIYDPTPIPASTLTAQLPDVDRNDVTVGGSMRFSGYDVARRPVVGAADSRARPARTSYMPEYKGTFDISAFVASVSLAGRFGQ